MKRRTKWIYKGPFGITMVFFFWFFDFQSYMIYVLEWIKKLVKFIENVMILKIDNWKVKTTFCGFQFLVFSFKKTENKKR